MFVVALDDLHTNRFKQGWFTLLKFTEEVKTKPHVMDEMRDFGQVKLDKPEVRVFHKVVVDKPKVKKVFKKLNLKIGASDDDVAIPPTKQQPEV